MHLQTNSSNNAVLVDLFPSVTYNGQASSDWQYVRETANHYSNGPVTDVTSGNMTCYQLAAGDEGADAGPARVEPG